MRRDVVEVKEVEEVEEVKKVKETLRKESVLPACRPLEPATWNL